MKTISVIIPAFNRKDYIASAIDSVLQQRLPKGWEMEVIVADDGSTDGTLRVVKTFGKKITLIKLPPAGKPAGPRNAALRKAKGELIAFQDSDDLWAPGKLLEQIPVFDDPNVVLSYGSAEIMDANGNKTGKYTFPPKLIGAQKTFKQLLATNFVSTLTVMVRRSALTEVGSFSELNDLRAVEDYELWLRIASKFPGGLAPVEKTLAYYRKHDQNISMDTNVGSLIKLGQVFYSLWQYDYLTNQQRKQLEQRIFENERGYSSLKNQLEPDTKPTISVIMSVYNGQQYLNRAVDSVLSQTFNNFEFIIIDDGSSEPILEELKRNDDPRMRIIPQTNHGLVYSLNQALKLARGNFIARMDSDDISLPDRFEKELKVITSHEKIGVVGSFFTYIDLEDKPTISMVSPTRDIDLKLTLLHVNPFGHGSTLIRKDVFVDVGEYDDNYHAAEDYDFWRRVSKNWMLAQVPESLYWYRINPASISHAKKEHQHESRDRVVEEMWQTIIPRVSPATIWKNHRYYQYLTSPYAKQIADSYLDIIYSVSIKALVRKKPRTFLRISAGLLLLSPRKFFRLYYFVCVKIVKHALINVGLYKVEKA
jgi:glycosyltransferase involved in cell wall biosynthesis